MNILTFLTFWADRVIQWFGNQYPDAINFLVNWRGWILYYAGQFITNVIIDFQNLTDWIRNDLFGWIIHYYNAAIAWINSIKEWLYNTIIQVRDWLYGVIQSVLTYAQWVYSQAINWINQQITNVHNFVQSLINTAITFIQSGFAWLYAIRDNLLQIVSLFTLENIRRFIDFLFRMYPFLVSFMTNPILFLFDILREKFISFLCMVLAYGLGTTIHELPNFNSWKD